MEGFFLSLPNKTVDEREKQTCTPKNPQDASDTTGKKDCLNVFFFEDHLHHTVAATQKKDKNLRL